MQISLIEFEVPVKSYSYFKISAMPALRFHARPALRVFFSLDIPEDIFRDGRE